MPPCFTPSLRPRNAWPPLLAVGWPVASFARDIRLETLRLVTTRFGYGQRLSDRQESLILLVVWSVALIQAARAEDSRTRGPNRLVRCCVFANSLEGMSGPDHPLDDVPELLKGERLVEDRRAGLSKEWPIFRSVCLRGNKDDAFEGLRVVAAHLVVERATVHLRHPQIGKDQVKRTAPDQFQAVLAVGRRLHVEAIHA